jgi:uncharacterized membrane protein YccF (DUF307 family)
MALTVIGLPWTRACFEIGRLNFAPFGYDVVSHSELTGTASRPLRLFRVLANILWLPLGLYLATVHCLHACLMFLTIVGIPFGLQELKIAGISLFPVGKRVVSIELMNEARAANARAHLASLRARTARTASPALTASARRIASATRSVSR